MAAGAWLDRVLPLITSSNAEGQELSQVWATGQTNAAADAAQVAAVAAEADHNYSVISKLNPPANLGGPAGLLDATLLARSKAADLIASAFRQTLGSAAVAPGTRTTNTTAAAPVSPASVVANLTTAASDMQLSDQAYQLFQANVPASLGVKVPPSTWATNLAPYAPQAAQIFLTTLQSSSATTPVHKVDIFAITTNPSPVSTAPGGLQTLPDAQAMTVTMVVADTGNQPENNLTVTAAINPAGAGTSSVKDFVNLAVGQAYTINGLGPLNPPLGQPVTLTVTVTGPAASTMPPATQTLTFTMPAPPPPSTTTTTSVPSASTSSTTSKG
jgi:hypothetical protein